MVARLALALLAVLTLATAAHAAPPAAAPAASPALDAYLAVSDALFVDDLPAAQRAAATLAAAADKAPLGDLAKAAAALAKAADLDAARLAFGDASKALIVHLVAHPGDAAGLHAFRCPMAKGFKKWVQRSETLANPYMGQRMPRCGGPTPLEP